MRDDPLHEARARGALDRAALEAMVNPDRQARLRAVLAGRRNNPAFLLEDVWDPHNISAILRTLEGLGLHRVFVVEANAAFEPSPQVSQGSHKWLDVRRHPDVAAGVADARALGYRLLATRMDAPLTLPQVDWTIPTAVVLGNEREGVTDALMAQVDGAFRIPMAGFAQSFNVSVAAAIIAGYATFAAARAPGAALPLTPAELEARYDDYLWLSVHNRDKLADAGLLPDGADDRG